MLSPYNGAFKVTSAQGPRWGKTHNGLDMVGLGNKYICAVCDGDIVQSRILEDGSATAEWGNYVALRDIDGNVIYHAHMSQRLVQKGQVVKRGDHLGIEGWTGYCIPSGPAGSHLHFEVRNKSGKVISAADYLGIPNTATSYENIDYEGVVVAKCGFGQAFRDHVNKFAYAADAWKKLWEQMR